MKPHGHWRLAEALLLSRRLGLPATLTGEEWRATCRRFRNRCAYCGSTEWHMVLEHFVAVRRGGGTTAGNCLPACTSCNASKRDEGAEWVRRRFGDRAAARIGAYLASRTTGPNTGDPGALARYEEARAARTAHLAAAGLPAKFSWSKRKCVANRELYRHGPRRFALTLGAP